MELVKPVEPVLWACIVELVMGGTGYGTVEALVSHYDSNCVVAQNLDLSVYKTYEIWLS